jgi:sugar phosphate isomerase/epimerase
MKLTKSICTNMFFPDSRKDIALFSNVAHLLADKGVGTIEFYHDGTQRGKVGKILEDTGLSGVYTAVLPSKEKQLYLCDEDERARTKAVSLFKYCIDEAQDNGIGEVMINSGKLGNSVSKGLSALTRSVEELFNYKDKKNYKIKLLMEPCDSKMEAFHLIGPYRRALDFVKNLNENGLPLKLTMDTAHTTEEGENFMEAITEVKQFCNHIHFANCYIKNPKDPLYGDKHLGYEYPDTEWTMSVLSQLFLELEKLYSGDEPLRIGLEVLCRTDDPYAYFEDTWNSMSFLH